MNVAIHLRVIGVIMLLLVAINAYIPKRFRWREEMATLSLLNRQIFNVHATFICVILVMFAGLVLLMTRQLLEPAPLGRAVLAGMGVFWFLRMLTQWFVYDPRIWRGDRLLTCMHYVFSVIWIYFVGTIGWAMVVSIRG